MLLRSAQLVKAGKKVKVWEGRKALTVGDQPNTAEKNTTPAVARVGD
jgi:hypothetical protein